MTRSIQNPKPRDDLYNSLSPESTGFPRGIENIEKVLKC